VKIRLLSALLGLAFTASAQKPTSASGAVPPVYVLYRMMFRHLAELDAAAANQDAQKLSSGPQLRAAIQAELRLSDSDAATLKAGASACLQKLDAQDAKASQVVTTARTAIQAPGNADASAISSAAIQQLQGLENERTSISQGCIQALQASLSPGAFAGIDFYVRTVVGRATKFQPPVITPITPLPQGASRQ
jgi:hypothetical protein